MPELDEQVARLDAFGSDTAAAALAPDDCFAPDGGTARNPYLVVILNAYERNCHTSLV